MKNICGSDSGTREAAPGSNPEAAQQNPGGGRSARERLAVFGRGEQLDRLDRVCLHGRGSLLVLRGHAGEGKTALLETAATGWRGQGARVLVVQATEGLGALDALLDGARRLLENSRDPQLLDAVATAARRRRELHPAGREAPGPDSREEHPTLLPLVHELSRALGALAARHRTAVVLEDVDRCGMPLAAVLCPLVQRLQSMGAAVVVSTRTERFPTALPEQLVALSDEVVDLSPLSEADVTALLTRWSSGSGRMKLDRTVVDALRAGLGPLFGNPGTLLAALADLDARGRLVPIDEHHCLSPADEPVTLPEQHPLVRAIVDDGDDTERLATALALPDRVGVDDLPLLTAAAAAGLDASGRGLDRLAASGVLLIDQDEQVHFAVPALAATLHDRAGPERVRALHIALARRLLAVLERGGVVDRERLADHLVHAGTEVDGELSAQVLVQQAERVLRTEPARAAAWCHGALRRLSTRDERWPRMLRTLLRLRTSLGQYRELAADVSLVAPAVLADSGRSGAALRGRRTLLHTAGRCWLSALLQDEQATGGADAARLFAALGGGPRFDAKLRRFAAAMFGGRLGEAAGRLDELFGVPSDEQATDEVCSCLGEVLVLLNAAGADHETFREAWSQWQHRAAGPPAVADPERLRQAGAMADYATALELVLGDGYGRPGDGSVLCYQEVLRAYLAGEWDAALSRTRRMETEPAVRRSAPARYLARAIAAEICSARGEHRRAAEWLERCPRIMAGGHVVAWVRCGVRYRAGAVRQALQDGWQDYQRYRRGAGPAGLERLLSRLLEYAVRDGRTELSDQVLTELTDLDAQVRSTTSAEAVLVARARLHRRPELAEQALALAVRRGDVPQLARVHLVVGGLAAEPASWLHESHGLAKRLGWHTARLTAQELMRERGVPLPRTRSRAEPFSSTEIRIIDLVSDGFTNRQIAMAVQVSEKTVESHLTRLFARTGCRSRVELAAASLEGRLTRNG